MNKNIAIEQLTNYLRLLKGSRSLSMNEYTAIEQLTKYLLSFKGSRPLSISANNRNISHINDLGMVYAHNTSSIWITSIINKIPNTFKIIAYSSIYVRAYTQHIQNLYINNQINDSRIMQLSLNLLHKLCKKYLPPKSIEIVQKVEL